jgi:protein-tyrosine phosphatase
MAESVASALVDRAGLSGEVTVESFGTANYHTGERAHRQADAALRRRGWPAGHHRARQIGPGDIAGADLILCADRSNLANVKRMAPPGTDLVKIRLLRDYDPDVVGQGAEVPDPWGGDDADFDYALDLIEQACRGLVEQLAAAPH